MRKLFLTLILILGSCLLLYCQDKALFYRKTIPTPQEWFDSFNKLGIPIPDSVNADYVIKNGFRYYVGEAIIFSVESVISDKNFGYSGILESNLIKYKSFLSGDQCVMSFNPYSRIVEVYIRGGNSSSTVYFSKYGDNKVVISTSEGGGMDNRGKLRIFVNEESVLSNDLVK